MWTGSVQVMPGLEFLDYFLAEVTKTYLSVGRHCIRN